MLDIVDLEQGTTVAGKFLVSQAWVVAIRLHAKVQVHMYVGCICLSRLGQHIGLTLLVLGPSSTPKLLIQQAACA